MKLLLIYTCAYLLTNFCTYIITYININDDNCIEFNEYSKFMICNIGSFIAILLYLFNNSIVDFIAETVFLIILIIIAYIDFKTHYIYEITSNFLLGYSVFVFVIRSVICVPCLWSSAGIVFGFFIIFIFSKLKFIGQGDLKIYLASFLFIDVSFLCPIILIILSLGISGVFGIIELLLKRITIKSRRALCPAIAAAVLIMMILT